MDTNKVYILYYPSDPENDSNIIAVCDSIGYAATMLLTLCGGQVTSALTGKYISNSMLKGALESIRYEPGRELSYIDKDYNQINVKCISLNIKH